MFKTYWFHHHMVNIGNYGKPHETSRNSFGTQPEIPRSQFTFGFCPRFVGDTNHGFFLWNDWSLLLLIEHHGKMMYLICHDFNWTPWSFSKNDWSLKKNVCLLLDKHRSVVGDVSCWSTHIQPMRFQPMMSQLCVGWKMFKRLRLWINQAHGHVYPMRHFHYIIILS